MIPDTIYETLPEYCRVLVDEIEVVCGFEIEVMSYDDLRDRVNEPLYGDIFPDAPGSSADFDKAFILFPGAENLLSNFDYHHELLHLHMSLVRGEPTLVTLEANFGQFAANVNNHTEHTIIYAEQYKQNEDWRKNEMGPLSNFWSRFPDISPDPDVIRFYSAQRYFITRNYLPEILEAAEESLCDASLLDSARSDYERLSSAFPDKGGLLRIFLEIANEPFGRYRLRTLDLHEGIRREGLL